MPSGSEKDDLVLQHEDTMWCWCDPLVMKLCPNCCGSEEGCGYCHFYPPSFNGLVVADDPDMDGLVVVHRG